MNILMPLMPVDLNFSQWVTKSIPTYTVDLEALKH